MRGRNLTKLSPKLNKIILNNFELNFEQFLRVSGLLRTKKKKAYEKEFLGSRDSHSDSGTDGGADRTGNYELHGMWTILMYYLTMYHVLF